MSAHSRVQASWRRRLGPVYILADAHCGQRCILDTAADGYAACQQRLPKLAGIQRCAAHVIRRYRAVAGLGPGSLQSWAPDVIEILRDTHRLTEEAGPGASPPPMRNRWPVSASATTRPSPRASPATGTGTGMTVTTPAALSAAGCATTPARSGCSPANPQPSGRTTSPRCRIRSYLEAVAAALAGRPPATRLRRGLSSHP